MAQTLQSLTGNKSQAVKVEELEETLATLWRSAAEGGEGGQAVTRACAMTLLVFAESEESLVEIANVLCEVTRQNPCRAILMAAEPAAGAAEIQAWVTAHCHVPGQSGKQVCSEQITLVARGGAVKNLENLVLPLTVGGLPVYLWWRAGRLTAADYLSQILRVSDHVLVDSGRFYDPESDLRQLTERIREFSGHLTLSDLNWIRLAPWRELIAQGFDSPETRPILGRLSDVQFEFAAQSPRRNLQEVQALLLIGWLASRLGWQPAARAERGEQGRRSFRFRSPRAEVNVRMVPQEVKKGSSGNRLEIVMKAAGDPAATFAFRRGDDGERALMRIELAGRSATERTVRLAVLDEAEVVNEDLKFSGQDRIYEQALETAARIIA